MTHTTGRRGAALLPLLFLTASLLAVPTTFAQRGPGGRMDRDQQLEHMKTSLAQDVGLTDEQMAQVEPLLAEHVDAMVALRTQQRGQGREAMREAMVKLQEELDAKIEPLLTEEQLPKYQEHKANRQGPRGGRQGGRRGGTGRN